MEKGQGDKGVPSYAKFSKKPNFKTESHFKPSSMTIKSSGL